VRSPLLEELFDYAGVFPPAALPLEEARAEYEAAIASTHGWVVGPMLVLASTLEDPALRGMDRARLGAVADVIPRSSVAQAESRVQASTTAARVAALEAVAPVIYLESTDPADLAFLEPIATARAVDVDVRAKIRTGGASADAFPSPAEVAAFIGACVTRDLPFKATAGLHHPLRTPSEVPDATEHGFVNLLAATRCALAGDPEATLAALASTDAEAFDLATATFRGVGSRLPAEEVRASFRSIGSCSTAEPTAHLADLGLL
jgi:hypothetical protein